MLVTMTTDKIFGHIQEYILNAKTLAVREMRSRYSDAELISDLWVAGMNSDAAPAKELREHYDNWTGEEKMARQRIKMFCEGVLRNNLRIIKGRQKIMNERAEEIAHNTMSKSLIGVHNLMFGYNMSHEERIIALWKCDLLTEEDVMMELKIKSRTTLFNRWNKLKERIRGAL